MSSEVCPFCGKTFKRLKSHLPHCKKAAVTGSETPPAKHDGIAVNQTTSSPQLTTALSGPTAKGEKSTLTLSMTASLQPKKSKKVSEVSSLHSSSPTTTSKIANTPSLSEPSSLNSASLPPSTKKKKLKLSEQIKTAIMHSSNPISLPASPTMFNFKMKTPPVSKEYLKSKKVSEGPLDESISALEDQPSDSIPFVNPLNSRTIAPTKTKRNPYKDLAKADKADPIFPSMDTKPKGAPKTKASKKKASQSLSTTNDTSSSKAKEKRVIPSKKEEFWVDSEEEMEAVSVNETFLKSGSAPQARITLQGVKSTLGRANVTRQKNNRPSILSQKETNDNQISNIRLRIGQESRNQENVDKWLVTSKALLDESPSTGSQHTELQSVKTKSSKSIQTSLIPLLRHNASPQPELTSLEWPLDPTNRSSIPRTKGLNEGRKVANNMTVPPMMSPLLSKPPGSHLFPLPAKVDTWRTKGGLTMEKSSFEVGKPITADTGTKGAVTQRSLGQVTLRELPEWLACRTPGHPRDVVGMVQRGWQWYYRRYIDVKKGGVGGVGMLLAGYCILSYIWGYPHIKRDRWRKYH